MGNWIPNDEFKKTEYGRLDDKLDPSKFYGPLIPDRLPPGSSIVPDPKSGTFGIIKDSFGNPLGKIKR